MIPRRRVRKRRVRRTRRTRRRSGTLYGKTRLDGSHQKMEIFAFMSALWIIQPHLKFLIISSEPIGRGDS